MAAVTASWHLLHGANVVAGGVHFSVWAPKAKRLDVVIVSPGDDESASYPLERRDDGLFEGTVLGIGAGDRYRYRLDDGASYPDPWSRSQPDGVHGASEVADPSAYRWRDIGWRGPNVENQVIYELHVGAFTAAGTFDAIVEQLAELRRLGVTAIELMPIGEFPGRRNWGYDGVNLFAPSRHYGGVLGLKRLVDAAHRLGLSVFLDVVYNHLGPDGNYLRTFSDDYFTDRHHTPWGDAINFDGPASRRVRELFIQNACYWLVEYHLDGLRLDATHAIVDRSELHVLAELASTARDAVGSARHLFIAAEDGRNDISMARPIADGGLGLDAIWADDFHHGVHVLLTGERDGYYLDYDGTAEMVATTIQSGFLYQGQYSANRRSARGTPVGDAPGRAFVCCLQNHDQVGNRGFGERLGQLASARLVAVATVLFLLGPETPLLFMGQEFGATTPFLYFTDHEAELGRLVTAGRRLEFAKFAAFREPGVRELIPDPQDEATFSRSRLAFGERERHAGLYRLHRELLRLRRQDPVFSTQDRRRTGTTAPTNRCVVLHRWDESGSNERLVVANFGPAFTASVAELPLLSRLAAAGWRLILSTSARRLGGDGRRFVLPRAGARTNLEIPEATALVFSNEVARDLHLPGR